MKEERSSSVLHLAAWVSFTMNIGNFFEFKRPPERPDSLLRDRDKEKILMVAVLASDLTNTITL